MDAYFCMGAYKHNVVVVIKMGVYIHGVLILCGCLLSRFYSMLLYGGDESCGELGHYCFNVHTLK